MNTREKPAFASLLTSIAALHNKNLPKSVVEIYWQSLQRFDFAGVARALQAHVENPDGGEFLPKPADIIRLLEGTGLSRALHAWAKVDKAIPLIGSYTSVVFDDALIHAVIEEMGGWIRLCAHTQAALIFQGNAFQKRYQGLLTQSPPRYPKVLVGRIETENGGDGYSLSPPTFIGDKQQAQCVMSGGGGVALAIHAPSTTDGNVVPIGTYLSQQPPA